jgi:sugar phosphate isomerase/epimerase
MNSHAVSRRDFVGTIALGVAAASLPLRGADALPKQKIITFSKPFRTLSAKETAALVADVGWDGLELPVRAKDTQFTPQQADELLPKFVEELRANGGREVTILTTDITQVTPATEKLLRLAAKLGITRYRLGFFNYAKDKSIAAQLGEIAPRLRDLVALNKELGLRAGFQNHSGNGYVGAPIWDVWMMIRELDAQRIGFCYDIGHATLEGGLSWPTTFRLASDWLTAVFVKDFYWAKTAKGWGPKWCPLGEGMIDPKFFSMLKTSGYTGPICQHNEYVGGDDVAHYKSDLATLRRWLAAA